MRRGTTETVGNASLEYMLMVASVQIHMWRKRLWKSQYKTHLAIVKCDAHKWGFHSHVEKPLEQAAKHNISMCRCNHKFTWNHANICIKVSCECRTGFEGVFRDSVNVPKDGRSRFPIWHPFHRLGNCSWKNKQCHFLIYEIILTKAFYPQC